VLSVLHAESEAADEGLGDYASEAAPVYSHPIPEIMSFFGPTQLVPPGLVDARLWRPAWEDAVNRPARDSVVTAGVARKRARDTAV
jgi:hypothetical protein